MLNTLLNKCVDSDFKKIFKLKGYTYFSVGKYNLNIIGIRKSGIAITNKFDDYIVVIYTDDSGREIRKIYPASTDPGLTSALNPSNSKGVAILVPGQYRGCWKIGLHKGSYKALCQCKPIKVYRDNNRDKVYNFNSKTIENGIFGINIHRSGVNSTQVDNWSMGCLVFKKRSDFNEFMDICLKQISHNMGSTFSYTLLTEEDLQ